LIQKGDIDRAGLMDAVANMLGAVQPGSGHQPARVVRRRRPTRPGKPLVLVVEDNPDNRRTARALLEDRFQVMEAQDGREGVDKAKQVGPDVVLMDIGLPVLSGIQALAEMRKDPALEGVPVIAVTASAMMGDREAILAHGFDGYLTKPIDPTLLDAALREALGG
jgi:CheY-like chemotaxis protein